MADALHQRIAKLSIDSSTPEAAEPESNAPELGDVTLSIASSSALSTDSTFASNPLSREISYGRPPNGDDSHGAWYAFGESRRNTY
jgi:hypothetical protein